MAELLESINARIEGLSLVLVTMDGDSLPAIGQMLSDLKELKEDCGAIFSSEFVSLLDALSAYLERMAMGEEDDLDPVENGVVQLQQLFQAEVNQTKQPLDISSVLSQLGVPQESAGDPDIPMAADAPEDSAAIIDDMAPGSDSEDPQEGNSDGGNDFIEPPATDKEYSYPSSVEEGDREIFAGFVLESLESLEAVEVQLVDLEQNASDPEIINSIFRAFHTIKGVSSFIGMMRINCLAHRAENLLDKIRDNELEVDAAITDVVFNSVDMLKHLIQGVKVGLENGTSLDIGLDISKLIGQIEDVQDPSSVPPKPVGQILVETGALREENLEQALNIQKSKPDKKLGQIVIEEGFVEPRQVALALREQKKNTVQKLDVQVKVDAQKLDNLVNLTGELVIAQSMLRQHPDILRARDQRLVHTMGQLNQITSTLQTITMALRMVPIKSTFQKMLRLVRDLSKSSGKDVRLIMSGEDTEIDRNVVDELYEPMVHMIRNSVDHGLETPEERTLAGKDPTGTITLRAYHKGGKIMVEIQDDGRGLNRERILDKAKSRGLIDDESRLSDTEIYNLIFQAGFSTAETLTEISGRGVGMDIVKKSLERLRGRVDILSRAGKGSTFIISLPLTLAIIEGMLVRVGQERYVIPALSIIESFRPTPEQCSTVEQKGEVIQSRGRLIPLIRLEKIFKVSSEAQHPWEGLVVTLEYDGQKMGLLLDELLGKEEVVIKSMGEALKKVRGIAGGAILGDGRVGLILDIAGIWELAMA